LCPPLAQIEELAWCDDALRVADELEPSAQIVNLALARRRVDAPCCEEQKRADEQTKSRSTVHVSPPVQTQSFVVSRAALGPYF